MSSRYGEVVVFASLLVAICVGTAVVFSKTMRMYEGNAAALNGEGENSENATDRDDANVDDKVSTQTLVISSANNDIVDSNTGLKGLVQRSLLMGSTPVYGYANILGQKRACYATTNDDGTTTITYTASASE